MNAVMSPWNAEWHLRAEIARIIGLLSQILALQRERGRDADAGALGNFIIDPGEVDGLATELAASWSGAPEDARESCRLRREIDSKADVGAANGCFLPLRRAAVAFDLDPAEYDAVLLALAVELDPRCGRLIAFLNDHVGHTRPTLGLAAAIAQIGGGSISPLEFCRRPAIREGLIELEGEGPAPSLTMRLDLEMARRLSSGTAKGPQSPAIKLHVRERGSLANLALAEPVRERLSRWSARLPERRHLAPLIVAGAPGSGRTAAVVAAAAEAGIPVVEVTIGTSDNIAAQLRLGRREARWYGAAALFKIETNAAGAVDWRPFWADLPSSAILETDLATADTAASAAFEEPSIIRLEEPGLELRLRMWQALLPRGIDVDAGELEAIAAAFHFSPGRIARAIRRALADSAGGRGLRAGALAAACRQTGSAAMGHLAQKLAAPYEIRDLVVPDDLRAELELARAWIGGQRKVVDEWGFARRMPFGRGLTALFSGPPGTGKTMAAQVLARELGLDIYRIDLSRVMNKYIGETEKNLARLFDEAGAAGAILFFDEADAIFGKRTEVRDAHDRYANIEIGYLLQRMEEHDGVTILATNRMRDMDEAFVRRFHFILNFPMPGESDRLRIWQGMFPAEADRDPDLDLRNPARHFELSGGEIRNIVLAAAFLAASENLPIGMKHLKRALRRELAKNGRVVDERALSAI